MTTAIDTSRDHTIALDARQKPCQDCGEPAFFNRYCGAWVCCSCQRHQGLARCYCGWSQSGRDGRQELVDMGETIGDEYPEPDGGRGLW